MGSATQAPATSTNARYIPRGRYQLHTIFKRHLKQFCDDYDERYGAKYGMFRMERIRDIGERFLTCGDYRLGWHASGARIRTADIAETACGFCRQNARGVLQTTFTPFSYKGFCLCPSCSQKRTLLFAKHLTLHDAKGAEAVLPS